MSIFERKMTVSTENDYFGEKWIVKNKVPILFFEPKIVDPSSRKHNLVVLVFIVVGQAFHHIFRQSMKIQSWQIPSIHT